MRRLLQAMAITVLSSVSASYTVWHVLSKDGVWRGDVVQAGQSLLPPSTTGDADAATGKSIEAELAAVHLQNVDLSLQLQLLQQQLERLQSKFNAEFVPASEAAGAKGSIQHADASLQETPEAQEASGAAQKNEHRERFALLEEAFFAEPLDPEWSATMETEWSRIESRLQHHTSGETSIEYYECRGSTCRVEFTHSENAPGSMPAMIASPLSSQVVLQSVVDGETKKTIALYKK